MSTQTQSASFARNEFYESLILLERDEPTRFANLSEATRRTVEHYKKARAKAERTSDV